ncbi:MAG: hypothetical protein VX359_01995 [Chloroflexota bacterium]|tara:strand:+ start:116 stop:274 length:159 start_codon:yes stop_codon:yes gene_type:complete
MREIIKETLNLLQEVKSDLKVDNEKLEKSIKNLDFILKEYKRLIDDFVKSSS